MENDEDPQNKRPRIDEASGSHQPELQLPVDMDSIKECMFSLSILIIIIECLVTQKITQLGLRIQQKQEDLAETRQKLEIGSALTRNLTSITQEFDQFVELILDQGKCSYSYF